MTAAAVSSAPGAESFHAHNLSPATCCSHSFESPMFFTSVSGNCVRFCLSDSAWSFLVSASRSVTPPKCESVAIGLLEPIVCRHDRVAHERNGRDSGLVSIDMLDMVLLTGLSHSATITWHREPLSHWARTCRSRKKDNNIAKQRGNIVNKNKHKTVSNRHNSTNKTERQHNMAQTKHLTKKIVSGCGRLLSMSLISEPFVSSTFGPLHPNSCDRCSAARSVWKRRTFRKYVCLMAN